MSKEKAQRMVSPAAGGVTLLMPAVVCDTPPTIRRNTTLAWAGLINSPITSLALRSPSETSVMKSVSAAEVRAPGWLFQSRMMVPLRRV